MGLVGFDSVVASPASWELASLTAAVSCNVRVNVSSPRVWNMPAKPPASKRATRGPIFLSSPAVDRRTAPPPAMTITLRSLGLGARTCRQLLNTQQPRVAVTAVRSYADAPVQRRRVPEYEYEEEPDEDRPWEFSDISSLAHGELEQHREARHYARIAAYEMPRLFRARAPPYRRLLAIVG